MVKVEKNDLHKKFTIKSAAPKPKTTKSAKPAAKAPVTQKQIELAEENELGAVQDENQPVVSQALGNTPRKIKAYDREYAAVIDTDVVVLLTTGEQVTGHFIRAFAFVLWISRDNKMVVINKAAVVYVQGLEQSKD